MPRIRLQTVTIGVLLVLRTALAYAQSPEGCDDYWPTWRGPRNTGVAPNSDPPESWSEKKNVQWKVALPGKGSSSPIVWGDRIFFQTAVEVKDPNATAEGQPSPAEAQGGGILRSVAPTGVHKFDVVCVDRETGGLVWQKTMREEMPHEGHHKTHGFASYSPVTDGEHVWTSFGSRGVHCCTVDGDLVWSRDLGKMATSNAFGEGSSPALAGDVLIVVMDHEGDSFITALDRRTGDTVWRQERDEPTCWGSPLVVEFEGERQVVVNGTNRARAYDAETGDVIWKCGGQTKNVIPTPVSGLGKVYCTSGFRGAMLQAITLGHTGDLTDTDAVAWQVTEATPYVPSPLLYDDKIYVYWGNQATLSCYDAATGTPHFVKQKLEDVRDVYASPVGAAGRVYLVGRNGVTTVIKQDDKFKVLSVNTLEDGFDASPAIAGDQLFLKGHQYLYCIAKK